MLYKEEVAIESRRGSLDGDGTSDGDLAVVQNGVLDGWLVVKLQLQLQMQGRQKREGTRVVNFSTFSGRQARKGREIGLALSVGDAVPRDVELKLHCRIAEP